jgi:hypothetical protein
MDQSGEPWWGRAMRPTSAASLRTEGIGTAQVRAMLRTGELARIRRGHYVAPDSTRDERSVHRLLIDATWPGLRSHPVLSHMSAAVMLGLPLLATELERVSVTRPSGGHGRRECLLHVHQAQLAPEDIVDIGGHPTTSLARTAIDLARTLPYPWSVVMCDAALRRGCPREQLEETLARASRSPGRVRAEAAVRFADPRAESPLESLSRVSMARAGLPNPVLQFEVFLHGRKVATCDFAWPEYGLVGEADGMAKYGTLLRPGQSAEQAVMDEKRREENIRQAGLWLVRWGWPVGNNPVALERLVRRGFELAPGSVADCA